MSRQANQSAATKNAERHEKELLAPPVFTALTARFCFCALLCFLWLTNSVASAQDKAALRGSPDLAPAHPFESDIAAFKKWDRQNAFPKDPILFVGSSSIRLWQTAEAFPDAPVINRGFGGSTIADVNHYFDRIVAKYKPRAIIFYAGDNDIAGGKSPEKVFDDFRGFVRLVSERLPKTPIYFISIKPSLARLKMWPDMQKTNALVQQLGELNDQVHFIDIATPMLASRDVPPKDLFLDDGLHLNDKGYELWNKILSPAVAASLTRD